MNAIVRRLSVWSAFKVGCAFHALAAILCGLPVALLNATSLDLLNRQLFGRELGAVALLLLMVAVFLPIGSILAGVGWAVITAILNMALWLAGGFEYRLQRVMPARAVPEHQYQSKFEEQQPVPAPNVVESQRSHFDGQWENTSTPPSNWSDLTPAEREAVRRKQFTKKS